MIVITVRFDATNILASCVDRVKVKTSFSSRATSSLMCTFKHLVIALGDPDVKITTDEILKI